MVVVSYSGKEINAKLVYYGAGLSGKTTNLEAIYEAVPDTSRGKMVSMKTQSDRTLFFDLLPLDLGEIMGFKTRFLLYTVPGQVFYNATRKLVLKGADAIVFVADSEVGKMEENKESIANLRANLAEYKVSLDDLPWVIQYNKRDLPNVYTCDELNAELNPGAKVPFFEAVATQGKGVFETFRGISHLLMEKVTKDLRRGPSAGTGTTPPRTEEPPRPRAVPAPPMAPGRAIEREARETVISNGPDSGPIEYGRQIELPDEIPPAPVAPVAAAPQRGKPAVAPPREPAPAMAARPAPIQAPAPAPVQPPAPLPIEAPRPIQPAMRARLEQTVREHAGEQPTLRAATPTSAEAGNAITIPVQVPAGQTGEILIRIVFKPAA